MLSEAGRAKSALSAANMDSAGLEFKLRSFEDIIYFLGEVTRVPRDQGPQASSPCDKQSGPIFVIHKDEPGLTFAANVAHAGKTLFGFAAIWRILFCRAHIDHYVDSQSAALAQPIVRIPKSAK